MLDFQQIIQDHHPILYKIERVYSDEEDFDDLYQEMLIAIWKSTKNFKGQSKLSTWLYRVALNTALSYNKIKKRKQKSSVNLDQAPIQSYDQSNEEVMDQDRVDALLNAIQQLKEDERLIILLYLEKKDYEEISDIMGITKSNVGVKINRIIPMKMVLSMFV